MGTLDTKYRKPTRVEPVETCSTPQALFDVLHKEYKFDLDACAIAGNAKCKRFITPEMDAFRTPWKGKSVFCNPPYGKGIDRWIERSFNERTTRRASQRVVLLLPAATCTEWWHKFVLPFATLRFVRGRVRFGDRKMTPPFSSVVVVFDDLVPRLGPAVEYPRDYGRRPRISSPATLQERKP